MQFIYYFLHVVWAFPTFIGSLILLFIAGVNDKPIHRYRNFFYVEGGQGGGGVSIGFVSFIAEDCLNVCPHEYGHSIQTLWGGPLMLFVISIPSCIRYGYREYLYNHNREKFYSLPPYDSIGFEGQATQLGTDASHGKWSGL